MIKFAAEQIRSMVVMATLKERCSQGGQGGQGGQAPERFLTYLVILCLEGRCSKQNAVVCLPKFLNCGHVTALKSETTKKAKSPPLKLHMPSQPNTNPLTSINTFIFSRCQTYPHAVQPSTINAPHAHCRGLTG